VALVLDVSSPAALRFHALRHPLTNRTGSRLVASVVVATLDVGQSGPSVADMGLRGFADDKRQRINKRVQGVKESDMRQGPHEI
jgi:hypothetical protein